MAEESWKTKAKRRWGAQAYSIKGDGQYALLTPCRVFMVTLVATREEAEIQKRWQCGGQCIQAKHSIVDLAEEA